jgi:hypothetical protein
LPSSPLGIKSYGRQGKTLGALQAAALITKLLFLQYRWSLKFESKKKTDERNINLNYIGLILYNKS